MARVLVLDDDPDVTLLVAVALASAGHDSIVSGNPSELPRLLAGPAFDAIVLDVRMPIRSGFEVLQELRAQPSTAMIPVLFLSAATDATDRVRGLREGADDYLAKPFAPDELILRLEKLIAPRRKLAPHQAAIVLGRIADSIGGDGEISEPLYLGRYRLLRAIGKGSMGWVFSAHDPLLERKVAVKILHLDAKWKSQDAEQVVHRLLAEARIVARFNHPNIVAIHDVGGEDTDAPYLAMELVSGMSLAGLLGDSERLPPAAVAELGLAVAHALVVAHQDNVVHGDIKPENVLLGRDESVKVTDFGFAHQVSQATAGSSKIFGTPGFIAPEVLEGRGHRLASDLFSLGAVLYRSLVGRHVIDPWAIRDLRQRTCADPIPLPSGVVPGVPPALDELIADLLEKDPDVRPSASDAVTRLAILVARLGGWQPSQSLLAGTTYPVTPRRAVPSMMIPVEGSTPEWIR